MTIISHTQTTMALFCSSVQGSVHDLKHFLIVSIALQTSVRLWRKPCILVFNVFIGARSRKSIQSLQLTSVLSRRLDRDQTQAWQIKPFASICRYI